MLFTEETPRANMVAHLQDDAIGSYWTHFNQASPTRQAELKDMVVNKIEGYTTNRLLRPMIGQSKTTINFRNVMDNGHILLVKLPGEHERMTELLGAMIIAQILGAALSRKDISDVAKRKQFNIYCDEFELYATDDFTRLLKECRKYGMAVTIAHQSRDFIDLRNRAASLQVANLVVFRVTFKDAQEELAGNFDCSPIPGEPTLKALTQPAMEYWTEVVWTPKEAEQEYLEACTQWARGKLEAIELSAMVVKGKIHSYPVGWSEKRKILKTIAQQGDIAVENLIKRMTKGYVTFSEFEKSQDLHELIEVEETDFDRFVRVLTDQAHEADMIHMLSLLFNLNFTDPRVKAYMIREGILREVVVDKYANIAVCNKVICNDYTKGRCDCARGYGKGYKWLKTGESVPYMKSDKTPLLEACRRERTAYRFPPELPTIIESMPIKRIVTYTYYGEKYSRPEQQEVAKALQAEITAMLAPLKRQAVYWLDPEGGRPERNHYDGSHIPQPRWETVIFPEAVAWLKAKVFKLNHELPELFLRMAYLWKTCRKVENRSRYLGYETPVYDYEVKGMGRYATEERIPRQHWVDTEVPSSEVANRIANELARLDDHIARIRIKGADAKIAEYTIETLDPKKEKRLSEAALAERIGRIKQHMIDCGYCQQRLL